MGMICKIKELLKEKGLTQKELSKAIGKSEITVSKYANGEKPSNSTGSTDRIEKT